VPKCFYIFVEYVLEAGSGVRLQKSGGGSDLGPC
jgi:hypothetical protein